VVWRNIRNSFSGFISCFLVILLAVPCFPVQAQEKPGQDPLDKDAPFHIVVIEGEGSINNIKQPVNRGAMVMVEDDNKNPLAGVSVTFFLPAEGPSGVFPDGSRTLAVFTDEKGLAASRSIRFNNQVGLMRMAVQASLFSQTTSASITQTNVANSQPMKGSIVTSVGAPKISPPSSGKKKKVIIVGAIAAAAVVATILLTRGGSSSSATITPGVPTIGAPK
jgi:hypothetical protein